MRKQIDFNSLSYYDWKKDYTIQSEVESQLSAVIRHNNRGNVKKTKKQLALMNSLISFSESSENGGYFWISRNLDSYGNCYCPRRFADAYGIENICEILTYLNDGKVSYETVDDSNGNTDILLILTAN